MAGNATYKGLAVPLYGESEVKQAVAGNDISTVTGKSGQTGDFVVYRDSDEIEKFSIKSTGFMGLVGVTTAPTTGLTKGDMFLLWSANSAPVLGICVSTATNDVKYSDPFDTETAGRTT